MPAVPEMSGKTMVHYLPYTKATCDAARSTKHVLFFHATWCPNCKVADSDIVKKLGEIPVEQMLP
ncbi:hypothetical protein [Deinococcus humi]|uniref:Thiol-disulfide isomerase/thioredoxin n=1 Tax=Deinococcus humi TaxID=662880 RepID=A0A7W8JXI2_9DEIO|nr:hypothetical protein [Deinococcus humi]MBB5365052.1 thiol-disulfide isomerase/thioredoxin [Deinococcus humi]GGO34679.1 hypothetical protein GCM10008949_35820 [Deinococcus humi]